MVCKQSPKNKNLLGYSTLIKINEANIAIGREGGGCSERVNRGLVNGSCAACPEREPPAEERHRHLGSVGVRVLERAEGME